MTNRNVTWLTEEKNGGPKKNMSLHCDHYIYGTILTILPHCKINALKLEIYQCENELRLY